MRREAQGVADCGCSSQVCARSQGDYCESVIVDKGGGSQPRRQAALVFSALVPADKNRLGAGRLRCDCVGKRGAIMPPLRFWTAVRRHGIAYRCDTNDGDNRSLHRETTASVVCGIQSFSPADGPSACEAEWNAAASIAKPVSRLLSSPSFGWTESFLLLHDVMSVSKRRQVTDMEGTIPSSLVTVTH